MTEIKIVCDICGKDNITLEEINKPAPKVLTMTEFAKKETKSASEDVAHLVFRTKKVHYKMTCADCNNSCEYTKVVPDYAKKNTPYCSLC